MFPKGFNFNPKKSEQQTDRQSYVTLCFAGLQRVKVLCSKRNEKHCFGLLDESRNVSIRILNRVPKSDGGTYSMPVITPHRFPEESQKAQKDESVVLTCSPKNESVPHALGDHT